jgi:hypothetical protein
VVALNMSFNCFSSRNFYVRQLFLLLALLTLSSAAQAQTVTISRTSGATMYWDGNISPDLSQQYISFNVSSTTAIADAWVQISGLSTGQVTLATGEDGRFHVGPLAANTTKTAFFLVNFPNPTPNKNFGDYTITLFNGVPGSGGAQVGSNATFSTTLNAARALQANANKVTGGSVSANPIVGGIVTVTVKGQTGTIGAAKVVVFSPATYDTWRPDIFELQATSIVLGYPNAGTFTNTLEIPSASLTSTANTPYTAT